MNKLFKARQNRCFALPKASNFNSGGRMKGNALNRCQRKFNAQSAIFSVLTIKGGLMNNEGWGYLILFGILIAPLIFWVWHIISKSTKGPYDDEFNGLV